MFNLSDNVRKVNLINRRLFIVTAAKVIVFWSFIKIIFTTGKR